MKDWYDMGRSSSSRCRPVGYIPTNPFKPKFSPLRNLPSCNSPMWVKPDLAHTYAINGWGSDLCASTVILLLRLGIFGLGSIQSKLDEAYGRFRVWCQANQKTSSLKEFSLKAFKIQKPLGHIMKYVFISSLI